MNHKYRARFVAYFVPSVEISKNKLLFRHNLPSNDYLVSHLTWRLFCTTWEKHNQRNITFLFNATRKNTFCSHFWHFGWQLSIC